MIKKCDFCGEEKEHYAKGFCRPCYSRYIKRGTPEYYVRKKQSREERLAKIRARSSKWRLEHPEQVKENWRKYYENNKERISKYKKEWYLKNRDRILNKGE